MSFLTKLFGKEKKDSENKNFILNALHELPRESPSVADRIMGPRQQGDISSPDPQVEYQRRRAYHQVEQVIRDTFKERNIFNVPFFASDRSTAYVMLQIEEQSSDLEGLTAKAVSQGKFDLQVTYHQLLEYPILRFLLTIHDQPQNPFIAEGLPRLTDGNVIDFLIVVIEKQKPLLEVF